MDGGVGAPLDNWELVPAVVPPGTTSVSTMSNRKIVPKNSKVAWMEDDDNWTVFAGRSTCAAVTHLGDKSQSVPVKVVWKITLVAGIIMTVVSTYFSASSFMDMTGNSEMVLQNLGAFVEHPKYHICTSNTFNQTILDEMGFVDTDMISYLRLMTSVFMVSPALMRDARRQHQLETKFNKVLLDHGIKDVDEIVQRALFKCEDIIAGCILPGIYVDSDECCATFFSSGSFVASAGACVTTTAAPPILQRIPSMAFGFVVFVRDLTDPTRSLDNSIINPLMANQRRVAFSLSDKWTNPNVAVLLEEHYTRFGLWTSLAISKTTINNEDVTQSILFRNQCFHRSQQDRYRHLVPGFDNYTANNCNFAFRQKKITEGIKCHISTIPYAGDLPSCSPQKIIVLSRHVLNHKKGLDDPLFSMQSECMSECWKEDYKFTASYADLKLASNFKFDNWTISRNQSKHLAALNFYYPTFVQTLLVNHYPTITQFLGVLGGNLGLFLGASMVTLIEVIIFFFNRCRPT